MAYRPKYSTYQQQKEWLEENWTAMYLDGLSDKSMFKVMQKIGLFGKNTNFIDCPKVITLMDDLKKKAESVGIGKWLR